MELSVGAVSGLIAVAIALLQLVVPNALTILLVSTLSQEHSAVTWSVVSHSLSNSIWPTLLGSDTTASRGVFTRVKLVTWSKPLSLALISLAAFLTPIGLYEDILPSSHPHLVTFVDVADPGIFGTGTPPRSDLGFSRECGFHELLQCPGTTNVVTNVVSNGTLSNLTIESGSPYDRRIPKVLAQLYESGLQDQPQSVASFFDIQARQYTINIQQATQGNQSYLLDSFRPLQSLILDNSIILIDGLIVDVTKGSVGFRQHTVPTNLVYGAEWNEDILFLEPETFCVDLNLTLEVQIPPSAYSQAFNLSAPTGYVVDQGGFSRINRTSPLQEPWFEELQSALLSDGDASLQARAYRAAWWTNKITAYYFNLTEPDINISGSVDSVLGQSFPVNNTYDYETINELIFGLPSEFVGSLPQGTLLDNGTLSVNDGDSLNSGYWANPWNISTYNYSDATTVCTGLLGGDRANITNLDVACSLVYGPARQRNGSFSMLNNPGSWWIRPIYSCASATKASIKTVSFNYNVSRGTGLGSLQATQISDKVYQNTSDIPIWGVETPNFNATDLSPLWGLISPELKSSVNLTTIQTGKFYIPASMETGASVGLEAGFSGLNFVPAVDGPAEIWASVYRIGWETSTSPFDYTGGSNFALLQKWQSLWTNTTGAAQAINLIWTDYAANYFTSTRSWLTPQGSLPLNLGQIAQKRDVASSTTVGGVAVHVYQRQIRYHFAYGVPAFICLAMTIIVCTCAVVLVVMGRGTASRLRYYLYNLSSGRLLGSVFYPDAGDARADTKTWIDKVGRRPVRLPGTGTIKRKSEPKVAEAATTAGGYAEVDQKEDTNVATSTAVEVDESDSAELRRQAD